MHPFIVLLTFLMKILFFCEHAVKYSVIPHYAVYCMWILYDIWMSVCDPVREKLSVFFFFSLFVLREL